MESGKFISERVTVEMADLELPLRFTWRGQTYTVVSIEASNRRLDFRSAWYRRRHRDYFIIKVDTGQRFELYHHRGPGKPYWVLTRELVTTA